MSDEQPNYPEWVANLAYVPKNLIAFYIPPEDMSSELNAALKHIFELRLSHIDGLASGYETSFVADRVAKKPYGYPVRVVVPEVIGKGVSGALEAWVNDHVTGKTQQELVQSGVKILFVEPDVTLTQVVDAWLLTGVFPSSTGEVGLSRDINGVRDPVSHELYLNGIMEYGTTAVRDLAVAKLDEVTASGINPYTHLEEVLTNLNRKRIQDIIAITDVVYGFKDFAADAILNHLFEVGHVSVRGAGTDPVRPPITIEVLESLDSVLPITLAEYLDELKIDAFDYLEKNGPLPVEEKGEALSFSSTVSSGSGDTYKSLRLKTTIGYGVAPIPES